LLRLLLPLNDKVRTDSGLGSASLSAGRGPSHPGFSPDRSIGRSDGRCVQRAGT